MNLHPHHLLSQCHMTVLKAMARYNDIAVRSRRKSDYVEALAEGLFQDQAIAASLTRLDPAARQLLRRLALAGGQAPTRWITTRLEEERILAPPADEGLRHREGGDSGQRQSRCLEDLLAQLITSGLVFSVDRDPRASGLLNFAPQEMLVIPPCVLGRLPADPLAPPSPVAEPATIRLASIARTQRSAYLSWNYVRHHPFRLKPAGVPPESRLCDIRRELMLEGPPTQQEAARISFLLHMLEEMGVLEEKDGWLRAAPDAESFFSQSPVRRARSMLRAWVESARWSCLKGDFWDQEGPRQGALAALEGLPSQAWIPTREWVWHTQWNHLSLFLPPEGNSLQLDSESLARHDPALSEFLRDTLRGPLHWLGLVSLGEGATDSFQLAPGASSALGHLEAEEERAGDLIVQPDFHILALPPVRDGDLAFLDEVGQRVKADRVFEYQLTRSSIYTAQQRGRGAQEIIDCLESRTRSALPQNVGRTLLEWERQHRRIVFHRSAALCQVAEPDILDELMQEPTVARWILRRPTPTEAILQDTRRFLAAIRERGHLAALTSQEEDSTRDSIIVGEDGCIRIPAPVPSIHVLSRLSKFAHGQGADLRITRDSIRKAIARRLQATDVLASLQAMNHGPLDEALVARVHAWARGVADPGPAGGNPILDPPAAAVEKGDRP